MQKIRLDITGETYGHLKALEYRGKTQSNQAIWSFECTAPGCGKVVDRPAHSVRSGNTKSCGCFTGALKSASKIKHGASGSSVYGSYKAMVDRCYNTKNAMYPRYGGRKIAVCERWLGPSGPANFWADMGDKPTAAHTVERIDNDAGYFPENCRWATKAEQADNRSTTRHITVDGKTLNQAAWDRSKGASQNIVGDRIRRGWDYETAVLVPTGRHKNELTHGGKTMSAHAWEIELGLGHGTIAYRIKKLNWSIEEAITTPSRKRVALRRALPSR